VPALGLHGLLLVSVRASLGLAHGLLDLAARLLSSRVTRVALRL